MTPNFATKGRKERKEKDHQGSILPQARNLREDQTTVSLKVTSFSSVVVRHGAWTTLRRIKLLTTSKEYVIKVIPMLARGLGGRGPLMPKAREQP
jgi:hypothetical protein